MRQCSVCRDYYYGQHQCSPVFEVRAEDEPDEWQRVRAHNAEGAACIFVANRDSFNEYGQVIDRMTVLVRLASGDEPGERYEVTGEVVSRYDAAKTLAQPKQS